jgi:hypothetical protein
MAEIEDPVIVAGHANQWLRKYDLREGAAVSGIKLPFLRIGSVCAWPAKVVVGVGFRDGAVMLVDTRMWLPIWQGKTVRAAGIAPLVAPDGVDLAFSVMNGDEVSIWKDLRIKEVVSYHEQSQFGCMIPHAGGAVVVDDSGATFLHARADAPIVRLFDGGSENLEVEEDVIFGGVYGPSVHQHPAKVRCGTKVGELFVTGDDAGFVNIWSICK